jgi:RNA polymerase sporulation-specific sigma factor
MNMTRKQQIEQALPLVRFVVKRYLNKARMQGIEFDDLFNTGCIGLIKAIDRFDPNLGFKFTTYAVALIRGEIHRYLRDFRRVSIPRRDLETAIKIEQLNLENENEEVISDRLGCSLKHARRGIVANNIKVHSIDMPLVQDSKVIHLSEMLPVEEDFSKIDVAAFLHSLSERERKTVRYRMEGLKQAEIGKRLGIQQVQVCRDLQRIGRKLEAFLSTDDARACV